MPRAVPAGADLVHSPVERRAGDVARHSDGACGHELELELLLVPACPAGAGARLVPVPAHSARTRAGGTKYRKSGKSRHEGGAGRRVGVGRGGGGAH